MFRFLLIAALLLSVRLSHAAQSPVGYWQTPEGGGVIEVTRCGNDLCAHLAGIVLDHPSDPMPTDYRGVSQCGLPLITDAAPIEDDLWRGHIIDPRNGRVYGVELSIDGRGRLAVRGYLAVPLFGQTDYWSRYPAVPPADCRMLSRDTSDDEFARRRLPR